MAAEHEEAALLHWFILGPGSFHLSVPPTQGVVMGGVFEAGFLSLNIVIVYFISLKPRNGIFGYINTNVTSSSFTKRSWLERVQAGRGQNS